MNNDIVENISQASLLPNIVGSLSSSAISIIGNNFCDKTHTQKITIDENIGYDTNTKEFYILVKNIAEKRKWNAYNLYFAITYYDETDKPIRTGKIQAGRLKAGEERRFVVSLSQESANGNPFCYYHLNVVLSFRNTKGKLFLKEQDCRINNAPLMH